MPTHPSHDLNLPAPTAFNDKDVLIGRKKFCRQNGGNRWMIDVIKQRFEEHEAADAKTGIMDIGKKKSKYDIKREIVASVKSRGGRFLRQNLSGAWVEVRSHQEEVQKVCEEFKNAKKKNLRRREPVVVLEPPAAGQTAENRAPTVDLKPHGMRPDYNPAPSFGSLLDGDSIASSVVDRLWSSEGSLSYMSMSHKASHSSVPTNASVPTNGSTATTETGSSQNSGVATPQQRDFAFATIHISENPIQQKSQCGEERCSLRGDISSKDAAAGIAAENRTPIVDLEPLGECLAYSPAPSFMSLVNRDNIASSVVDRTMSLEGYLSNMSISRRESHSSVPTNGSSSSLGMRHPLSLPSTPSVASYSPLCRLSITSSMSSPFGARSWNSDVLASVLESEVSDGPARDSVSALIEKLKDGIDDESNVISVMESVSQHPIIKFDSESALVVLLHAMDLHPSNQQVQEHGCVIINSNVLPYSQSLERKQLIVPLMENAMQQFPSNEILQESACMILNRLSINGLLFLPSRVRELILSAMRRFPRNKRLRKFCLDFIKDTKDIELFAHAMKDFASNQNVQAHACRVLRKQVASDDSFRSEVFKTDGILKGVIRAMKRFPNNEQLQEDGCHFLRCIDCGKDAIDVLLQALRRFPNTGDIVWDVCEALGRMSCNNEENAKRIGQKGGVQLIVDHIKNVGVWSVCSCFALEALVSACAENRELAVDSGGITIARQQYDDWITYWCEKFQAKISVIQDRHIFDDTFFREHGQHDDVFSSAQPTQRSITW